MLVGVGARDLGCLIRKDPVKFRVAIPAADPPDNAQSRVEILLGILRASRLAVCGTRQCIPARQWTGQGAPNQLP